MKNFLNSELWKWIRLMLQVLAIAAGLILIGLAINSVARADVITEEVWVLCEPDGLVNIRSRAGGRVVADARCGDVMWTENKVRDGFLHVTELNAEVDEGWISGRYIVYDQPHEVNEQRTVTGDGRMACRKWIGGKIKGWVQDAEIVTVYWMSEEWAVTEKGYIRSAFLGELLRTRYAGRRR